MRIFNKSFFTALGITTTLLSHSLFAWTEGQVISNSYSSLNPALSCIAIDQNSNTTVGWLQGNLGVDAALFTASLPAESQKWNEPIPLYTGTPPIFPTFPGIYADNNGTIHSLWANFHLEDNVAEALNVLSSTQNSLESTWQSPTVSGNLEGFPNGGEASVDKEGNEIVILALTTDSVSSAPPYSVTFTAKSKNAANFTSPTVVGLDNIMSSPVVCVSASHGYALIGWKEGPTLSFKTSLYNFSTGELTPTNNIPLPAGTLDVGFAKTVLASNGDAIMAFSLRIGASPKYVIYSSFLPKGNTTWTFPEPVSNSNHDTIYNYLSIKADKKGNSTLLWGELNDSNNGFIRVGSLPFGKNITEVQNLTNADSPVPVLGNENSNLSLEIDHFGNKVAIWQFIIDNVSTVQVSSKAIGNNWMSAQNLSQEGHSPRIALSNQGTAVAVWVNSVNNLLTASIDNFLFPLPNPSHFQGYISEEEDHTILNFHWNPSLAPNIINYEIFNGDKLIASVSGNGPFTYQEHLKCDSVEGSYTLVAVASNGNKSSPIEVVLTE